MTRLTLDVLARKIVVDSAGAVREVPVNDLTEVGAFAAGPGERPGAPLYQQWHRVRSGAQRMTSTVPATATWAGVDPRNLLFDLSPGNNVARLRALE